MAQFDVVEGSAAHSLAAGDAQRASVRPGREASPRAGGAERAALVVDDFYLLAKALSERMALDGYATTIAGSVEEANDLCGSGRYELILVDWSLPDGDGLDVVHLARRHNPNAYVVLMSGFAVSPRDRRLRGCVDAVLCKPWRPGELQTLLENAAKPRAVKPGRRTAPPTALPATPNANAD